MFFLIRVYFFEYGYMICNILRANCCYTVFLDTRTDFKVGSPIRQRIVLRIQTGKSMKLQQLFSVPRVIMKISLLVDRVHSLFLTFAYC